jgi:hypothetical protein
MLTKQPIPKGAKLVQRHVPDRVRVATITKPLAAVRAGYAYTLTWKAPRAPKKTANWTFCATASDATGNTTPRRCAPLYLR